MDWASFDKLLNAYAYMLGVMIVVCVVVGAYVALVRHDLPRAAVVLFCIWPLAFLIGAIRCRR